MKNIYKILFGVLATFLLLFALDWAVGTWSEKMYYKSRYGIFHRQIYCLQQSKDDILILGSSRAAHHYVPQIFEDSLHMSCYNAGSDGECIYYNYCILASIIERGFTPKIVVYEVMNLDAEESQGATFTLDAALDRLAPHYGEFSAIDSLFAIKGWKERVRLLSKTYRYNSKLVQTIKCNYLPEPEDKGYEALNGQIDTVLYNKDHSSASTSVSIEPAIECDKVVYMKKLIKLCKDNGIRLILCYSPYYKNDKLSKGIYLIKDIAAQNDLPFYIFNNDKDFEDASLFNDEMHLNDKGARSYTNKVIRIINHEQTSNKR